MEMQSNQRRDLSSDDPQQRAAGGLGDFAGALRRAARESDGGAGPVSRIAETAAENLQRFSDALRGKDLDGLLRDAESFARRQPLAFIGAAAVAGFVAVRFLKSSAASNSQPDYRKSP